MIRYKIIFWNYQKCKWKSNQNRYIRKMNNCNKEYKRNIIDNKYNYVEVNLMMILYMVIKTGIDRIEKMMKKCRNKDK